MTNEKKKNLYMRLWRKLISACNKYIFTCACNTKARVYIYLHALLLQKRLYRYLFICAFITKARVYIYIYMHFSDDKTHV